MDNYKITIRNWSKHNPKGKKGYTHFMLSKRIFSDDKIVNLKANQFQFFIYLLSICADMVSDSFVINAQMLPKQLRISNKSLHNHLMRLQSFQLLDATQIDSPYLIEKNRIEENRIEKKLRKGEEFENHERKKPEKQKCVSLQPAVEPLGKILMARYCELWKSRYGSNPAIQKHHPKILKDVGEQNGSEKTLNLLENYFKIPDPWIVKKGHDIPTFVSNLASVARFMESGKVVSNSEMRQMDSAVSSQNTLEAIRRGEI